MSVEIQKSRMKTNRFKRLNGNRCNISIVNQHVDINSGDIVDADEDEGTFIDIIYSHLAAKNCHESAFLSTYQLNIFSKIGILANANKK